MREWNDSRNSRPTYFNNFETIKTIMTHKIFHVSQPVTFVTFTWFGLPASLLLCRWTPGRSLLRSCKTWPLEIWELLVKLRKHFESSELEDHSSMFANIPRTCAKVEKLVVTKSTQEDPMLRFQFICKALVTCEATLEPSLENRRFEVSNSLNGLNPLQHSIYCLTWMWKVLSFSCFSCDVGGCFLWKKDFAKKKTVPLCLFIPSSVRQSASSSTRTPCSGLTNSVGPPLFAPIVGVPHAMHSMKTMPKGSL